MEVITKEPQKEWGPIWVVDDRVSRELLYRIATAKPGEIIRVSEENMKLLETMRRII